MILSLTFHDQIVAGEELQFTDQDGAPYYALSHARTFAWQMPLAAPGFMDLISFIMIVGYNRFMRGRFHCCLCALWRPQNDASAHRLTKRFHLPRPPGDDIEHVLWLSSHLQPPEFLSERRYVLYRCYAATVTCLMTNVLPETLLPPLPVLSRAGALYDGDAAARRAVQHHTLTPTKLSGISQPRLPISLTYCTRQFPIYQAFAVVTSLALLASM